MEKGICEVMKEITPPWSASEYTIGIVTFKQAYDSPPEILLTPIQTLAEKKDGWVAIICSVMEVTNEHLIIDFDGLQEINGELIYRQEVYPGAKCFWAVI